MNNETTILHQPHSIQQQPPSFFKPRKILALFITIVILTALLAGLAGYQLGIRTTQTVSQNTNSVAFQSFQSTEKTTTVIIQDSHFFKVTIPHEYGLIKGDGDYIRYVTNRNGENIIGFYINSHGGESLLTDRTVIDGVHFNIEGELNNTGIVSCSANLYATNAQLKLDHLYFGIYTWCKEAHEERSDVYDRIIRSIQFSEDLRAVLLGKSPPPMLRY